MKANKFLTYVLAAILFAGIPAQAQIIPRSGAGAGGGGGGGDASAANQTTQISALPLEDSVHTTGDRGSFVLGVENADLAALTLTDKDYTPVAVTNQGAVIGVATFSSLMASALQLGKGEDSTHTTGDAGVPAWGVINTDGTTFGSTGDYGPQALSPEGYSLGIPVFDSSIADQTRATSVSDRVAGGFHAGMVGLSVRDGVLSSLTPADGDFTYRRVDAFGSGWTTPTDGAGNVLAKLEDILHVTGDAGIPALVIRNSATTPTAITGLDLRYSMIGVTSLTQVLTTQHHSTAYLTSIQVSKLEDTPHATGDAGIPSWVVRNDNAGTTFAATDQDYTPIAATRNGLLFSVPVLGVSESPSLQTIAQEDIASGAADAGTKILSIRDDVLGAGAGVGADGDYFHPRGDNFGAGWTTPTDGAGNILARLENTAFNTGDGGVMGLYVYQEDINSTAAFGIASGDYAVPIIGLVRGVRNEIAIPYDKLSGQLIGINDVVDQDDFSGDITKALPFTAVLGGGELKNVCLRTAESGTGIILTPDGQILIFSGAVTVVAGDTTLTAAEWGVVEEIIPVLSAEWVGDTLNGAVVCKDVDVNFAGSSTGISVAFLSQDVTSFNSLAGDDETLDVTATIRYETLNAGS